MSENSKIEWTDHTFNPWIGCTKVSPGCAHCYAETQNTFRGWVVGWGKGSPRRRTSQSNWDLPVKWNKAAEGAAARPRVFCASLADWLDDEVPIQWLADLMRLIAETPNLDWLLLTKRPQNFRPRIHAALMETASGSMDADNMMSEWEDGIPPTNVWIGTSAEDQIRWNERMPLLMDIPARIRFISAEPLIGRIHMGELRPDWLIVGGESGSGARPMEREWVEHLRDQCDDRTAFLFKQWGEWAPAPDGHQEMQRIGYDREFADSPMLRVGKKKAGRLLDGVLHDETPKGGTQ